MFKSLLARDLGDLGNSLDKKIKYVDIDFDVKRHEQDPWTTKTRSTFCKDDYAILNAYRMWLLSKKYDYCRSPSFGGLFGDRLNDKVTFSVDNEEVVKDLIKNQTAEKWPDITLIDVEVTADIPTRQWKVRILAQDKGTKLVLSGDASIIGEEQSNEQY